MSILGLNCSQADFFPLLPGEPEGAGESGGFGLWRCGEMLLGLSLRPTDGDWRGAARQCYRELLQAAEGHQLYRIWNQVPAINEIGEDGLEHYRSFSAGRAEAFESHFGAGFCGRLPAASAVGTDEAELTVAFLAGQTPGRHFENPEQVPAYRYPSEHGPRAPSFARATSAQIAGRPWTFISGTAAIKGHLTIGGESLERQLECTLHNLSLIAHTSGAGRELRCPAGPRHIKVYFRNPGELPAIRAALTEHLLTPRDDVLWRRADLCRSALKVEVEVTLLPA